MSKNIKTQMTMTTTPPSHDSIIANVQIIITVLVTLTKTNQSAPQITAKAAVKMTITIVFQTHTTNMNVVITEKVVIKTATSTH